MSTVILSAANAVRAALHTLEERLCAELHRCGQPDTRVVALSTMPLAYPTPARGPAAVATPLI